jgi:hypothetical protein
MYAPGSPYTGVAAVPIFIASPLSSNVLVDDSNTKFLLFNIPLYVQPPPVVVFESSNVVKTAPPSCFAFAAANVLAKSDGLAYLASGSCVCNPDIISAAVNGVLVEWRI